eukprot:TRINITY_DN2493_c0_g1_i2.p1 TRINITY_DN2493_c0_g1~~TRINITY_DN2493_c0_g1_i2.p1  ORF type:complete len:431 (-),score=114.81 TRINITY_DN2493_c0_g1_i2:180-1472(-)
MTTVNLSDAELDSSTVTTLARWRAEAQKVGIGLELYLGADVGGTNTRVAVINENERIIDNNSSNAYLFLCKFKASTLLELTEKLRHVGQQFVQASGTRPVTACLAIAGPVSDKGRSVSLTNYVGEKQLKVNDLPAIFCPHDSTIFINDLASTCHGINSLGEENLLSEYFESLWSQETKVRLDPTNYAVLSMGTGLGCGILALLPSEAHEVISTENGHSTVSTVGPSHPNYDSEVSFINYLGEKLYNGKHAIEWEDICSGRGLLACYEYVTRNHPSADKSLDAASISKRAVGEAPDEYCRDAMYLHFQFLFRSAQQQCVGLNCKGFFLTGDNQIANNAFVTEFREKFHSEYLNHPKAEWIGKNQCYRQIKSTELNLRGALYAARLVASSAAAKRAAVLGTNATLGNVTVSGVPSHSRHQVFGKGLLTLHSV